MVFHSLTDAPRDFREGIDWLVALKGTDAASNLKAISDAVYNFLVDKPAGSSKVPIYNYVTLITKGFLEQEELKDRRVVGPMLWTFNKPKDPNSDFSKKFVKTVPENGGSKIDRNGGITGENITEKLSKSVDGCETFLKSIQVPGQYKSAYSSKATWEASCSDNPQECAAVFVGIAPMLYAGLTSLWDATDADAFRLTPDRAKADLENLLNALRYVGPECRASMGPSDVANALRGVEYNVLGTLGELSDFWTFHGLDSAGVSEAEKYYRSKYVSYPITGGDNGVNMGLVNAWNSKLAKKPAKTDNALGSDNIYYPGMPTVANLNAASPI
ncbi:hypothetical protein BBBOND_0202250 [Babesia bigemina]|uniref:Variant erythrocyte surface antigen-1, beta subunit n=1 Tax=Babesia bigemina TaxID=5866 RepID=A0A061D388_BABBI|nr:hypothetical protein BBBOND_0202250 [Babesia bigemina]CDR95068.1 hypothetical protein BBBOND_0202250 [Babesia bigemina]|eukprot:XP_012767254.1 hypothetical protein BBBOND_0202250 [Babesia bigemina]